MQYDENKEIFYLDGFYFDAQKTSWHHVSETPKHIISLTRKQAIKKLQQSKNRIRIPIGVVGTNKPTVQQYELAKIIGHELGLLEITILCGGQSGVMEAVCKGAEEVNGVTIGLLPESNIEQANQFVSIPLATGIGFARGSLIASSSLCLIAIGGGNGTLVEVASGLQFGKKVFALESNFTLQGVNYCQSINEIIHQIYLLIFNIDETRSSYIENEIDV